MKRVDIARRIARQTGLTRAEAADRLDGVVSEILDRLRQGKQADLPGLGSFRQDSHGQIYFERSGDRRRG
jgi:nucleoid DNA-binding protein